MFEGRWSRRVGGPENASLSGKSRNYAADGEWCLDNICFLDFFFYNRFLIVFVQKFRSSVLPSLELFNFLKRPKLTNSLTCSEPFWKSPKYRLQHVRWEMQHATQHSVARHIVLCHVVYELHDTRSNTRKWWAAVPMTFWLYAGWLARESFKALRWTVHSAIIAYYV